VDFLGVLMIGAGGWVLYEAYKGKAPFTTATNVLKPTTTVKAVAA
jgi:uncharacterized membrane protein